MELNAASPKAPQRYILWHCVSSSVLESTDRVDSRDPEDCVSRLLRLLDRSRRGEEEADLRKVEEGGSSRTKPWDGEASPYPASGGGKNQEAKLVQEVPDWSPVGDIDLKHLQRITQYQTGTWNQAN